MKNYETKWSRDEERERQLFLPKERYLNSEYQIQLCELSRTFRFRTFEKQISFSLHPVCLKLYSSPAFTVQAEFKMCHLFTYKYIVYHVFPHKTVTTKYQAIEINSKSSFLPDIQMMEGFFKNHVGANYFLNNFFDYKPQSLSV